jgi:hypothetical protein
MLTTNQSTINSNHVGLNCSSVSRLKRVWSRIPAKYTELFASMEQVMTPLGNFKYYRQILAEHKDKQPIIPYLGNRTHTRTHHRTHTHAHTTAHTAHAHTAHARLIFFFVASRSGVPARSHVHQRRQLRDAHVWYLPGLFRSNSFALYIYSF